jgi:hypothetical protein
MGSDPEFFFKRDGKIVESKQCLADKGLKYIVEDGIQGEIHPTPSQCRAILGAEFTDIFNIMRQQNLEALADFSQNVKLTKEEMDSIPDDCKRLGCNPSLNVSEDVIPVNIDGLEYPYRSAGGHIHIDTGSNTKNEQLRKDAIKFIKLMDVVVGNTCVLIDRDKGNITRRKVYGRAGEYRIKPYGLEYRTLSNFWLRSYPLYTFVFGLARYVMSLYLNGKTDEVLSLVDYKDIREAINKNDKKLAKANFDKIKGIFPTGDYNRAQYYKSVLDQETIPVFEKLIKTGIMGRFSSKVISNWLDKPRVSFETWILKYK